mgnify:FL=1
MFIKFNSFQERPSTSSNYSWIPVRQSCSDFTELVPPIENNSTFRFKTPVPEVIHQNQFEYSPTHSQMKGRINIINKS